MLNNYIPLKFLGARSVRRLLTALLFLLPLIAPKAFAALTATVDINGVKYLADYDTRKATVKGLADGVKSINNLVIPATIDVEFVSGLGKFKCDVTKVDALAFCDGKLTGTLELGWQIEEIGMLAFANNPGLTGDLVLPQEIKVISDFAFRENPNMKGSLKVNWWTGLKSIGRETFGNCGFTGTLTIPSGVTYIGMFAFHNCKGFTGTLKIPENVQSIDEGAFSGCSGFTGLSLGRSLQSIGTRAFADCSGLQGELTFPEAFWSLGSSAFTGCSGLSGTLTIPSQVTEIPGWAFMNCSGITDLVIPSSVTTIGGSAFYGCNSLKSVTCEASTPPVDGDGQYTSFDNTVKQNAQLNVKSTSKKLYQAAFDWKDFKKIVGDNDPSSVSLDKPSATLNVGGTVQLTATISPSDAYNEKLTWSTSNASVATVDANGKVTAVSRGTANITVTTDNGKSATCAVTVNQPVTSVSVDLAASGFTGGKAEMRVSESKTLKVTVNPANANDKTLTYSSSNAGIVSVDNNGVIKANALGSSIITVTASSGVKTTLTVTVVATPAERINLNKTTETLKATETLQLTAEVLPATTTDKTVKWTSSNNAIATVDGNGKVTAVAVGSANITATCGTVSATCSVTVVPTPAESVNLNKTTETLKVTNELQLTATILPATTTDKTVTWTSSDSAVATVDANGKVTAVSVGKATITATCGTVSGTCTITVVPMPASSVTLNQSEASLKATETVQLTAEVLPVTTTDKTVTWTSSDNAVATVDNDGLVTAVAVGTVNITATCGTVSGTCVVTVVPTPAESVTLDVTEATLNVPETLQLTATILPATTTDKTLTWTSSNEAIAAVDANGKVTAVKAGECTITVTTTSGKSATLKVTVLQPALGIAIDYAASGIEGDTLVINVPDSKEIKVTVTPDDSTDSLTWTSSNTAVATVDSNGKVTAVKAGEATITVTTTSGKSATLKVTVLQPALGITIDYAASGIEGDTLVINVPDSKEIKVTVTPDDSTDSLTWTSSNEAIATVDANGKVTAVKAGECTITVTTTSGKSATLKVTVLQPALGIAIDYTASGIEGDTLVINVPDSKEIKVTVTPDDSTDSLTWTSSNEAIATVDANGTVTAVKAGEATITVTTTSGKSATLKVTVLQPALGIAIDYAASGIEGDTLVINVPDSKEIKVTVTPDNSTDSLTWTSSNEAIAAVDANGTVTAVKAGEATITVTTTSGKSATLKVTVLQPALGIEVSEEDIDLEVGETAQLTATILPDDSTDTEVVWETSDASIATVDANGLVTGIALGEAEITVSVKANPAIKAVCKIAVVPTLATMIYLDKYNMTTVEGVEFDLVATVLPDDVTDKTVAWSSSDETIATVDDKGHVKVLGSGECDIIAATTDGSDLKAACKLNALSGVYMIWSDSENRPDIYSINGMLVKKGCSLEDYMRLEPGIYIVGGQKILKR